MSRTYTVTIASFHLYHDYLERMAGQSLTEEQAEEIASTLEDELQDIDDTHLFATQVENACNYVLGDREDNPAKPGIRAARASEVAAEKEMRASWKAASDVMYGYAHGVYARETLDKYIDRFVAAVEAERGARDHLHEIEQARKGRTGNPSHSGLPLGSLALGAAVGAAVVHFKMKPKQ